MTRWTDAPIVGGAYSDDTRPWSVQDTVNLIPVYAEKEGTRSPKMLRCAPGYSDFADLGTNAPIRGMRNVEGLLLVVSGSSLFSIAPKGQVKNLGVIPGVGRVILSHNQITGGNEVAITPGYIYNTVKGTLERITDEGFPGAKSFDYIDSYFTFIEPGGRFAGISDLAAGMSYNTNDRFEAEGSPDKIVGQIVSHEELWLFGERTAEPFRNTGATNGTFQRAEGMFMEVGAASPYAIVNLDNSFFWLGGDGVVYRANGYTPVRISTHPIEQAISRCTMNTAFAFTFEDRGHKIFYLTFQDGQTWGYDVATQEWHRRQSKGLNRWRVNDLVSWNGMWIAGDFSNGKLYKLDWDVQAESDQPLERMRVTGVLADDQNAIIVNAIELVMQTGMPGVPATLTISGDLGDGKTGDAVTFSYIAANGTPTYHYTVTSGSLPAGLAMDPQGHVTGTRTDDGFYTWTVQATDVNGIQASLVDSSTTFDSLPIYTGNFRISALAGDSTQEVDFIVPKGVWKLAIADIDTVALTVDLYVDNAHIGSAGVSPLDKTHEDVCVGGSGTHLDDPANGAFRGLMWGAGVFLGAMTQDDRDAIWNGGNGRTFADLESAAPDTYAELLYAWQLDQEAGLAPLPAAKGGISLTLNPTNCRSTVMDGKFGRVTWLNAKGRMQAIGSGTDALANAARISYFSWIYSGALSTDTFPAVICQYTGTSNPFLGLRSTWVSNA